MNFRSGFQTKTQLWSGMKILFKQLSLCFNDQNIKLISQWKFSENKKIYVHFSISFQKHVLIGPLFWKLAKLIIYRLLLSVWISKLTHDLGFCERKVLDSTKKILFFSLDQPVTKNQKINTKCHLNFFVVVSIRKEKTQEARLFTYIFKLTTKRFSWYLVFSICFLVTDWSNENNKLFYLLDKLKSKTKTKN